MPEWLVRLLQKDGAICNRGMVLSTLYPSGLLNIVEKPTFLTSHRRAPRRSTSTKREPDYEICVRL